MSCQWKNLPTYKRNLQLIITLLKLNIKTLKINQESHESAALINNIKSSFKALLGHPCRRLKNLNKPKKR